jgi:hypothetical protein
MDIVKELDKISSKNKNIIKNMNNTEKVIKIYNDGQDNFRITDYDDDYRMYIEEYCDNDGCCPESGDKGWVEFYQFIFSPKYGVFEVFGFYLDFYNSVYMKISSLNKTVRTNNTVPEIINYLAGVKK